MGELHDRVPVILEPEQFEAWLTGAAGLLLKTIIAHDLIVSPACRSRHSSQRPAMVIGVPSRRVKWYGCLPSGASLHSTKPHVPHAGSRITSSGLGATSSTIAAMMWRGVRNWPFWPAVAIFAWSV